MNGSQVSDLTSSATGVDPRATADRTQRTWLDDEGILHAEALPGAEQKGADAEACVAHMWEVGGRRRRPVLIDLRHAKAMDRDARTYYAGPETAHRQLAAALLIESPLSRVLGNFFLGLNKPLVRTRVFTSEREALAWLRTFPE